MKPVLTHAQFEGLLQIIAAHCRAWQDRSGHAMQAPRDMVDFLVDARRDDAFWNELDQWQRDHKIELEARRLRSTLPKEAFPSDLSAVQCLVALGVTQSESEAILGGIDQHALVQSSVESAFATLRPFEVAEKLEQLAGEDRGAIVAKQYVDQVPVRSKRAWVTAALIGAGFLFLLGAAGTCAASTVVLYKGVTLP